MSRSAFGPGAVYITRTDIPNQAPINIGYAQEFEVDESGDLVENYGQNQYALDAARATVKATGKFKAARLSGLAINAVFHGETMSVGSLAAPQAPGETITLGAATTQVTSALTAAGSAVLTFAATTGLIAGQVVTGTNIPAGTAITSLTSTTVTLTQNVSTGGVASGATITFGPVNTVNNGATFSKDLGVTYKGGLPLLYAANAVPVGAGQYSVNAAAGQYFFHPTDAGKEINSMYAYTQAAVGQSKTVHNQPIGYTPTFQIDYVNLYQGGIHYVRIYKCVANKFSRAFKLKEFVAPAFDFAIQDDGTGRIYTETYPEVS